MQFMILVKATKDSEAGARPPEELFAAMADYHEQLVKAGVLLDASGLQPSSKGWRIKYSGGKRTVIDGPFTEAKELVAGYTMIQVKSREEALEWSRRFPNPAIDGGDCEIEVRQLFELEDFGESEAIDRFREMGLGDARIAAALTGNLIQIREEKRRCDLFHWSSQSKEWRVCRPRRSWMPWTNSCKRRARKAASWSRELGYTRLRQALACDCQEAKCR